MSGHVDDDTKRKIAAEEGMSLESYNEENDKLQQMSMDMATFHAMYTMTTGKPARTEQAKALKIKERIEAEEKKAEERRAGPKTYVRWVIIYDGRFGSRRVMEVEVDEGANANFLTKGMATDRRFRVQSLEEAFNGETINGDVICHEYAQVTLWSQNPEVKPVEAKFYILPANDPPNDPRIDKPIVGRHLLQEAGHLLLTENPRDPVWSTKMGKESAYLKEQSQQQAANVEAYQANQSRNRDASRTKGGKDKQQKGEDNSSHPKDKQGN